MIGNDSHVDPKKFFNKRDIYLDPNRMNCLNRDKTQITDYDPFKADIYAIGIIML